jgi:hypothetical protein
MNGSNNQYKTKDRIKSKIGQVRIKSIYMLFWLLLLIIPDYLEFVFNKSIFEVIFDVFELPEFVSREFLQVERRELFIRVYGLDA